MLSCQVLPVVPAPACAVDAPQAASEINVRESNSLCANHILPRATACRHASFIAAAFRSRGASGCQISGVSSMWTTFLMASAGPRNAHTWETSRVTAPSRKATAGAWYSISVNWPSALSMLTASTE